MLLWELQQKPATQQPQVVNKGQRGHDKWTWRLNPAYLSYFWFQDLCKREQWRKILRSFERAKHLDFQDTNVGTKMCACSSLQCANMDFRDCFTLIDVSAIACSRLWRGDPRPVQVGRAVSASRATGPHTPVTAAQCVPGLTQRVL